MIRHVVLFTLRDPDADADRLVERLRALPAQIDDIVGYEVGRDIFGSDMHVGLVSSFADLEALDRYRVHPAHQEAVAFVQEVCEARVAFDTEVPG